MALAVRMSGKECSITERKKERENENEKERLNKLSSRTVFSPANSTIFLGVMWSAVFLLVVFHKFIVKRGLTMSRNNRII